MNPYSVERRERNNKIYFLVQRNEDGVIVESPTTYLAHLVRANKSMNTVKRRAFSISYYLTYLEEKGVLLDEVSKLPYAKQHKHFTDFLRWIKDGKHTDGERNKLPGNFTCNLYLKDVFGWFGFLALEHGQFGELKVLSDRRISYSNQVGVRFSVICKTFNGYLPEEEHVGRTIEKDKIETLLEACENSRDQLLLLLLAETGFRIGELLGVRYTEDIDYKRKTISVNYRNNMNNAFAKNAEHRRALISEGTFGILMYYLAENRELLKNGSFLMISISGKNIGKPLDANAVYSVLKRLEMKTGIKVNPHMLRHYFANERRKSGWDILLISKALGHKHINTTIAYLDVGREELIEASDAFYAKNKGLYDIDKLI